MQLKHEFEREKLTIEKEQKIKDAYAQAEKKKQSLITIGISIGLLLVVFFLFFFMNRYRLVRKQKSVIEYQKQLVDEKQKAIVDSINYAKRIQETLLANEEFLNTHIPNHFALFKPKDIVSGDFYWATQHNDNFYLAVCDSTGHGVPGAFMSLLSIGFLSEAINEKGIVFPNEVFNYVRMRLIENISKDGQRDGFDGILLCINSKSKEITYSAAHNNPLFICNDVICKLNADKMPVGLGHNNESFQLYSLPKNSKGMLYLYTDGYADQFGGPTANAGGKKFRYKQLDDLLTTNSSKSLNEQKLILENALSNWQGSLEQVDDITVIGIKI
jgi:serine phosphatase RsbU (regulator of sigma subunit)